jgi:glycosyltransferase involved in cell wall biosynthesis
MTAPSRLRVLLVNWSLGARGGTECAIRDIALGLRARDHAPMVYSPVLGPIADEIAAAGIPVVDDLGRLGDTPDIIHAHHFYTTGEALIHFPQTPAIHICHGWSPALERPPRFPQIRRYLAVSSCTRDNIVNRAGIAPARAFILHNAVDHARITPRLSPLAETPARAAAFLSGAHAAILPALEAACHARGIAFGGIGAGLDDPAPERHLVDRDLIFATGRSASEALAAGCAVIVADGNGLGGMVTGATYERFRRHNFGLFSLTLPLTPERIGAEISRYDARDAALVSARHAVEADFDAYMTALIAHYRAAIADYRAHEPCAEAIRAATQIFLRAALPVRLAADGSPEPRPAGAPDAGLATVDAAVSKTVAAFHGSTSWRVTAPLRWLKGRGLSPLRRLRGIGWLWRLKRRRGP